MAKKDSKIDDSKSLTVGGVETTLSQFFAPQAVGDDNDQRGSEQVGTKDLQIPRIDLLQDLSPQIKEDKPEYIEGAEPGLLFNTLTGHIYGDSVIIVPVFYALVFNLWIDRKKGGGFRGAFQTEELAKAEIPRLAAEEELTEGSFQIVETALNFVLVLDPKTGRVDEACMAFSKTKMSASRKLNSLIRLVGGARWRRAYKMTAMSKTNKKGDFYTIDAEPYGFVSQEMFERGEQAYETFSKSYRENKLGTNFEGLAPDGDGDDNSEI